MHLFLKNLLSFCKTSLDIIFRGLQDIFFYCLHLRQSLLNRLGNGASAFNIMRKMEGFLKPFRYLSIDGNCIIRNKSVKVVIHHFWFRKPQLILSKSIKRQFSARAIPIQGWRDIGL